MRKICGLVLDSKIKEAGWRYSNKCPTYDERNRVLSHLSLFLPGRTADSRSKSPMMRNRGSSGAIFLANPLAGYPSGNATR